MRRSFVRGSLALLIALAAGLPSQLTAQFREPPPPPAYALQNVTVVTADGAMESGMTVVVRNGLIAAMGSGVSVPADATVLEGDSLYVYPGIVDPHADIPVEFPEIERPEDMTTWNPTRAIQGMMPHRKVVDHLALDGEGGADMRKRGVVAAGVHTESAMAGGQSAAVILRKDAEMPWQTGANPNLGLQMSFSPAQGAYPSQLFGVIAFLRQSFEDAARHGQWIAAYAADPEGVTMPPYDPDYEVLRTVTSGGMPVFFAADDAEDIRRVLMLSDEYGFSPVVVGGTEAWEVADELAARNVPVLVDVDFRRPTEWDPEAEDQTELEPAAAREKEEMEAAYSNPALLHRAGVRFAFTSNGGDGELREGARKAIEYGLPMESALAAVTSTPARMLGIPNVVMVEEGVAANFIVTDGPLFEEGSNVSYTFVEGVLERGRAPGAAPAEGPAVNVAGTWTMSVSAAGQELEMEWILEQEGNSISGSAQIPQMGQASISGTVGGNEMNFVMTISAQGQTVELEGSGTVEGDTVTGSGSSPFGPFDFTGTREPGDDR